MQVLSLMAHWLWVAKYFDQKIGFPGAYYAGNITPDGLSKYSDGELLRLITTGVTRDGRAIFPVMPYSHYARSTPGGY
jgi:Cu2+-containing amine oxidase